MSLSTVKSFIRKARTGFLATTDGKRPGVRPMSAYAWYGKEFWLAGGAESVAAADIARKPMIEICFLDSKTYTQVRLAGRCRLSRAAADKKKMFGAFPWMKDFFESPASPDWVVLRVTPKRLRMMTMKDMAYKDVKI